MGITLTLREYDRNTTKSQYKAIQHWLRSTARLIEPEVNKRANQAMSDLLAYGTCVI